MYSFTRKDRSLYLQQLGMYCRRLLINIFTCYYVNMFELVGDINKINANMKLERNGRYLLL